MNILRTLSTRGLVLLVVAMLALTVGVVIAVAARSGAGPTPPEKPLAKALLNAARAPEPQGISARIAFTNNLFPSGSLLGEVGSALMSGASGRLWMTNDGRGRLELQSTSGDAQVGWTPADVTVFDASSNTVYHAALPTGKKDVGRDMHAPPTLDQIENFLSKLGAHVTISPAQPANIAGRPAYTVSVGAKSDATALHAVGVAWDVTHGVPLRVAVDAKGFSAPVLELKVTHISYGPVSAGDVAVSPPASARKVELGAKSTERRQPEHRSPDLTAVAPRTLARLPRTEVRRLEWGTVVVYGKDLGSIVIVERSADAGRESSGLLSSLPAITLHGVKGHELATPLGTVVEWRRDGVDYVAAGSLPSSVVEAAARSLR